MATIENRSRYIVTVRNRDDLTKTFAYTRVAELREYIAGIKDKGLKPQLTRTNDTYADTGLQRLNLAEVYAAHKPPHPKLKGQTFKRLAEKTVRKPAPATRFICKPFADVVLEDFNDYIDDRCQSVEAATVDREIDLFSATCRLAIDTWRIPVAQNPMDGGAYGSR